MLPSFLLSLREGIEAALIIGIVLGVLRQLRRPDCAGVVWSGVACAIAASLVGALLLNLIGWSLEGPAEPIYEGIMLLTAAGLLTWMIFWIRGQSKQLRGSLESGVRQAVCAPGPRGLFILTFVAVAREGIELALFLTAAGFNSNATQTLSGAALGLVTATLLGWSLFTTTSRLNLRRFFQVTGTLLILFAAGMVATAIHEFNELGWIPAVIEPVWNTDAWLSEKSTPGLLMKSLFGYTSTPSLTAAIAYVAYLIALVIGTRSTRKVPVASTREQPAPAGTLQLNRE